MGQRKLFYIDSYLEIFCTGMKNKWKSLVYADLLAGPGISIDPESREEQEGSALLAIRHSEFVRLFINDIRPEFTQALRDRTGSQASSRIQVTTMDCNEAVDLARGFLFPSQNRAETLGLAVIDPTAFQMRYEAIARLTKDLPLDLIIIVMTGYMRRFVAVDAYANALDGFFGTDDWRRFVEQRKQGFKITYEALLDLYCDQLRQLGYQYVSQPHRTQMRNSNRAVIYHMIFASKHKRGADFSEKITRRTYSGQRRMLL
ncbi:MAG: three-Cys-motif partner protein TcmP [Nitrolancea sp.]